MDAAETRIKTPSFTVLQVTPELDAGGVERTTVDIAAAIVKRGGRALVASRGGRLEEELADVGGELARMRVDTKNPARILANAAALASLVRRENVDIIHARSRAPAWSALWAARMSGRPFVTTYHGTYNAKSALKRWYNSVMARGDRVIANSGFIRDHIIAEHGLAPEAVTVIARGVDVDALDPKAVAPARVAELRKAWGLSGDETRPVILLPGRLTRWKGQSVAIEALGRLAREADGRAPGVLVLVGDAQGRIAYVDELNALAAAEGVGDAVLLPGHCTDMPAAYALADVVVSASIEPEAFGRVAVEGQCMGRPVIATDHGGARETVLHGETGYLCRPGDSASLAEAMRSVLAVTPSERLDLGDRAAARARRLFSVQAMQTATLAVYEEVLEGRSHE